MSGSRMNSVRSINTSLPAINHSGIALLTAGPINLANATVGLYGGEQERSSFRDQYQLNLEDLIQKNPGFGAHVKASPRGNMDYPMTMVFDENAHDHSMRLGDNSSRTS